MLINLLNVQIDVLLLLGKRSSYCDVLPVLHECEIKAFIENFLLFVNYYSIIKIILLYYCRH